jgi:hypothetical protein
MRAQPSKFPLQRMRLSNTPDMQPHHHCWAKATCGLRLDDSVTAAWSVSGYPANMWGGALWQAITPGFLVEIPTAATGLGNVVVDQKL